MKKGTWKKVLIIVVALVVCFTIAACTPEKKTEKKVGFNEFIGELIKGIDGMIKPLADATQKTRHIDVTLVANIKDGTTSVADLKIRIAGNFNSEDLTKNEVRLEIANDNVLLLGIYEKGNKIYLQESISTGKLQKLSIEGIAAFNLQQYLAKLPEMLSSIEILKNLDLNETIGGLLESVGPAVDSLFDIAKEKSSTGGTKYIAKLIFSDGEGGGLFSILNSVVGSLVKGFGDILNEILPGVLGMNFTDGQFVPIEKDYFPEIAIQVFLADKTNAFEGLTFDYKFPKKGAVGNNYNIEVGLQNINISNTDATVNDDIVVADYIPGAIKVSADLAVPGLLGTGVNLTADFYLQPGFGSIDGTATEENKFIKVQLIGKLGSKAVPLVAEYKYIDVKVGDPIEVIAPDGSITMGVATRAQRMGRLYFDIAALYEATGVTPPSTGTKYFKDIDLSAMLFGVMDLSTKTFDVDLTTLADEDKALVDSVKISYIGAKNAKYYTAFPQINGSTDFWNAKGTAIAILKDGNTIGNAIRVEYTEDARIDYVMFGTETIFKITLPYATWLPAIQAGGQPSAKLAIEKHMGETAVVPPITEKDPMFTKPENNDYFYFPIYDAEGNEKDTIYVPYTGAIEDITCKSVLPQETINKLLADKTLAPDIKGLTAKIYLGKSTAHGTFNLFEYALEDTDKVGGWLPGTGAAAQKFFLKKFSTNYRGFLFVVYEETLTTQAQYNDYVDSNSDAYDYVINHLSRYLQTGESGQLPKMTTELEVYGSSNNFNFDMSVMGGENGLIDLVLGKLGGLNSGKISLNIKDAAKILGMGKYLADEKIFAAQIRMLLSNEKATEAFQTLAVNAPYKAYEVGTKVDISKGASETNLPGVVKSYNTYLNSKVIGGLWAALYGRMDSKLDELKADGWTDAQATAYTNAADEAAKAKVFATNEYACYAARVALRSEKYNEHRLAAESKAMDTIRAYIGKESNALDSVATVYDLLYGDDGIQIDVSWKTDKTGIIAGMPLSIQVTIKRGSLVIADLKAGIQFIEASKIPESGLAADYWNGAVNIHTSETVSGEGYVSQQYSSLVVELVKMHVATAGTAGGFTLQDLLLKRASII